MPQFGYFLALLIGLVIGLIGGGGSILGVPVFAYVYEMDAFTATTLSLFVVGVTSALGTLENVRKGQVEYKTALFFGLPSVLSVVFMRGFVVPRLPKVLWSISGVTITTDTFILVLFALLMLYSSFKMIFVKKEALIPSQSPQYFLLSLQGLGVGMLTGLIGAGGGFLIVPALVMLLNVEIKKAIGTSMLIISLNSLIGFVSSSSLEAIHWPFLLIFTGISILGMWIGFWLNKRIDGQRLKPIFGGVLFLMALFMIIKECFL